MPGSHYPVEPLASVCLLKFLELNRPIPTRIGCARCQNEIVYVAVVAAVRRST